MPLGPFITRALDEARSMLLYETAQGNLAREHHFRDYLATLQQVATLWDAQRILEELLEDDEPEA